MKTRKSLTLPALFLGAALWAAAYGAAQAPKEAGSADPQTIALERPCPHKQLSVLAEVKVEKTAQGALLRFIAKDPDDVVDVQAAVELLAKHLKSGYCPRKGAMGPPAQVPQRGR